MQAVIGVGRDPQRLSKLVAVITPSTGPKISSRAMRHLAARPRRTPSGRRSSPRARAPCRCRERSARPPFRRRRYSPARAADAPGEIIEPIWVAGSSGSPTLMARMPVQHLVEEFVLHLGIDDLAHVGRAVLAAVPASGRDGVGDEIVVDRRIVEHDERALAAHLEADRLQIALGRIFQEIGADLGRAGEGDDIDAGMAADRLAAVSP